jgi:hypothetical protein
MITTERWQCVRVERETTVRDVQPQAERLHQAAQCDSRERVPPGFDTIGKLALR